MGYFCTESPGFHSHFRFVLDRNKNSPDNSLISKSKFCDYKSIHGTLARPTNVYVVVIFLSPVIFLFFLFLGMVMYANEDETREK